LIDERQFRLIVMSFFEQKGKVMPSAEVDLFQAGVLDSMELIDLLAFLDMHHDIRVPPNELTLANFKNINSMFEIISKFN
jgi:acyl carrier protein